jgi:putative intracellular protease/amidase
MKRLFSLLLLCGILVSFAKDAPKVLLYMEGESMQLQYMLTHEVGKMEQILKQAGFEVVTATMSGEVLKTDSVTVKPDLKLSEVNVNNYAGFIMPCMAVGDTIVTLDEINFVKKVVKAGKPIAEQFGAVLILGKADVLKGKKFAFLDEKDENVNMFPAFKNGIYSGKGIVQDGNIITSGVCPWMAKEKGYKDGTDELTRTLINVIKAKTK